MSEFREFSAKTVEDAITRASLELECPSSNLVYEIIEKGSAGFFGIGSKNAVIKARRKEAEEEIVETVVETKKETEKVVEKTPEVKPVEKKEEKKPEPKKEAPKAEKAPRPEKKREEKKEAAPAAPEAPKNIVILPDAGEAGKQAEEFLKSTFAAMGMEVETEIVMTEEDGEKTLTVDLSGSEMGILIGKRGQTLDSLQYLVSLVVNKGEEEYIRVKVDTENYRARRKATLEKLAKNIAAKVKRTHRPVTLEPMNPYERRIIHSTLQNDRMVTTKSEGEEPNRRVVVSMKNEGKNNHYRNNNRQGGYRRDNRRSEG